MTKLGWKIIKDKNLIRIYRTTKETEIVLEFEKVKEYKGKCYFVLRGNGDLEHHLIEDVMRVVNKLAELKGIGHQIK